MKKRVFLCMIAIMSMLLSACGSGSGLLSGSTKTLHCDHCGKAVEVPENSKMEEDWILFCEECNEELGIDELVEGNE